MEIFSRIDPATSATYGKRREDIRLLSGYGLEESSITKIYLNRPGIEKEPETWQEFVDCAAKLKAIGVEPYLDDADNVHNLAQDLYQCSVISQEPDADVQINEGVQRSRKIYRNAGSGTMI